MSWSDFENYVYTSVRRNFPAGDGWAIEPKKRLAHGGIVDWVVYRGTQRAVIDVKDKLTLTLDHIEQVANDRKAPSTAQMYDALQACMNGLNERARNITRLRYEAGTSCTEIANRMKTSVAAIYQLLSRIRSQLADCVWDRLVEETH